MADSRDPEERGFVGGGSDAEQKLSSVAPVDDRPVAQRADVRGLLGAGPLSPPAVPVDAASVPDNARQAVEQRLTGAGFRRIRGAWRR